MAPNGGLVASCYFGGYPIFMVSDLFTPADKQRIRVDQPRVYFGELISQWDPDYAIVGAMDGQRPREYDSDVAQYTYTGKGGVPIGNWINRLSISTAFATGVAPPRARSA